MTTPALRPRGAGRVRRDRRRRPRRRPVRAHRDRRRHRSARKRRSAAGSGPRSCGPSSPAGRAATSPWSTRRALGRGGRSRRRDSAVWAASRRRGARTGSCGSA